MRTVVSFLMMAGRGSACASELRFPTLLLLLLLLMLLLVLLVLLLRLHCCP